MGINGHDGEHRVSFPGGVERWVDGQHIGGEKTGYASKLTRQECESAAKDAEIAALRQRCGRLRELFDATIDCQSDESTDKDWLRRDIAYAKCIKHNDLDEKEPTDG